jgi:hypothetical protein
MVTSTRTNVQSPSSRLFSVAATHDTYYIMSPLICDRRLHLTEDGHGQNCASFSVYSDVFTVSLLCMA